MNKTRIDMPNGDFIFLDKGDAVSFYKQDAGGDTVKEHGRFQAYSGGKVYVDIGLDWPYALQPCDLVLTGGE